ncbi:hypothetical protein FACS1894184_21460 [Clostridia bacterium]|nr:hypothetical protein FACS1894184_21460 [Clostridia bacterium]
MKLQEFKEMMDTDATRRCEAQTKTITELLEQIKELQRIIQERDRECKLISNRCYELSHGKACCDCWASDSCRQTIESDYAQPT